MSFLNKLLEKKSKTKELFAQLRTLDPELQGLTILQALNKLYAMAEKKDRKACALAYLGLQYLQHSLHFHEPEFGTGEAIAYALYNIHKPRLQKLREHYLAMYGENTIKFLQRCVDASLLFFTEAIKLEPEFGWAYYWRTSVYRYMLDMPKAQKDIQKARELRSIQMSDLNKAKDLNDEATALAQRGSWLEARAVWLEARDWDNTWAVPSFNLARNYLDNANYFDNTLAKSDVKAAEKYINETEKRASLRKHSEDNQVLAQLPQLRQWLSHKKNELQMI